MITTQSGKTREIPKNVDFDTVVGLDQDDRIVVKLDFMGDDYLFGLTLCCNAFDKGVEDGVVCRACYDDLDIGNNIFQTDAGTFPGLDPKI